MGQSMFDNWDAFESFVVRMNRRSPDEAKKVLSLQNMY